MPVGIVVTERDQPPHALRETLHVRHFDAVTCDRLGYRGNLMCFLGSNAVLQLTYDQETAQAGGQKASAAYRNSAKEVADVRVRHSLNAPP
jgi:hypothetical protein